MLEAAIATVLENGIRTGDIWSDGMQKVGTAAMGTAVIAELDRAAHG
jgi:3-isopropylmalate dehydrogenase